MIAKRIYATLTVLVLLSVACGVQTSILPVLTVTPTSDNMPLFGTQTASERFSGTPSAVVTPEPTKAENAIFTVGAVWVRSEPSGVRLYALPAGSEVRVEECREDGWCRVDDGWLWAGCLGLQGRECRGE